MSRKMPRKAKAKVIEPNTKPLQDNPDAAAVENDGKCLSNTLGSDEEEVTIKDFTQANVVRPFKSSILNHLNGLLYDPRRGRSQHHERQLRKMTMNGTFERLELCDTNARFETRVTEMCWHPKEPYMIGTGSKHGDILLMKGCHDKTGHLKFTQVTSSRGVGPGGSILSIRFDENRKNFLYTAGLEGIVNSWDIERMTGACEPYHEFYNTRDYSHWFTSMDVSQPTRTLLAGCTKGRVYLSTLDGEKVTEVRLHKGKVLHCEFNQAVPHLIVTSSIDKTVKLWDLRKLSESSPLQILVHDKPVNVAHFNNLNSSRLLTSDQRHDIRVYESPNWTLGTVIKHPHRQFQHLTAIVANWHPLSDVIVIGKYPVCPKGTKPAPPRPIQFFDPDSGHLIHELFPATNEIVSLNVFNPIGDVLASGQGRSLLFFNQQETSQGLVKSLETLKRLKDAGSLRRSFHFNGNRRRENSDSESENEDTENDASKKPKRKKQKMAAGGTKTKPQTRGKSSKK